MREAGAGAGPSSHPDPPYPKASTRLSGRWRLLASGGAGVLALGILGVVLGSLPVYYALLTTVCTGPACITGQPAPDTAQTLQLLGLSITGYARLTLALTLTAELLGLALGALLVWRKPGDWLALLVALMLLSMAPVNMMYAVLQTPSGWQTPATVLNVLGFGLFFLVVALFPSGVFAPTWTRWLPLIWLAWSGLAVLWWGVPVAGLANNLVWLAELGALVLALVYRYRALATPLERQQTKVVVLGWSLTVTLAIALNLPAQLWPALDRPGSLYDLVLALVNIVVLLPGMLSIALAIMRYRLWDIDALINRTLVYGMLTLCLALLYAGLVTLLQHLFEKVAQGLVGQTNNLAVVLSTLAIVAVFQPLRLRLQRVIDRRFYRQKYNAAQAVATFGATLRTEVELTRLREQLEALVQETLQPTQVSLWIRASHSASPSAESAQPKQDPSASPASLTTDSPSQRAAGPAAPQERRPQSASSAYSA